MHEMAGASLNAAQNPSTPQERLALAARLWDWFPHAGQHALLTQTLADGREPKVLVAACGRRWGKTEALSADIAARILLDCDLGQMGVAPTRDQAETLFEAVAEKIQAARENEAACAEFPHLLFLQERLSPYPHFRRKDNGMVVFSARTAGRNGRGLRGKGTTRKLSRFRIIVDERAFVPDEAVERALLPMLATVPQGGGQLVEISSPNGKRGGFYRHFLRGESEGAANTGTYRAVRLPSHQNPLVDAAFLSEMRETMSAGAFRAEFEAEFADTSGTVFPDADIQAALCDDDYGDAPLWGAAYVAGVDFGRRADWTVAAICALVPAGDNGKMGLRVVALLRLRGLTWAAQVERVAEVLQKWNVQTVACDQTGVGDAVTEALGEHLRKARSRTTVEGFTFGHNSKAGLIDRLALLLSQNRLRFPPHPDLVGEMGHFVATPMQSGNGERLEAASGNHDDCVCALALAAHAGASTTGSCGRWTAKSGNVSRRQERKGVGFFMWWKRGNGNTLSAGDGVGRSSASRLSFRARSGGGRGGFGLGAAFGTGDETPGGLTTFVEMQRDAQVRACLTTKRLFILSGAVSVVPADDSTLAQKAAQTVEREVQKVGGWAGIAGGALDALAMGLAVGELVWADTGSLQSVVWHDPRRFAFHFAPNNQTQIAFVEIVETEQTYPADRFILYAYQGKWSSPLGQSDLTAAFGPWERKNALQRMWLSALDRFGAPTPIARVPVGWNEADTERLARQLGSLQNESAFVLPADVELTTLEGGAKSAGEPGAAFLAAVDFENREIARAILGQELTTHGGANASGGGSHALGHVHQTVLENWVCAVRADLSETVLTRQIARPIVSALLGDDAPCPRVAWATDDETNKMRETREGDSKQ